MNVYEQNEEAVLALEEFPMEKAPSNLVIARRYILPPEIFSALEITLPGKNNEVQLTDALKMILGQSTVENGDVIFNNESANERRMYGVKFDGVRHNMRTNWTS